MGECICFLRALALGRWDRHGRGQTRYPDRHAGPGGLGRVAGPEADRDGGRLLRGGAPGAVALLSIDRAMHGLHAHFLCSLALLVSTRAPWPPCPRVSLPPDDDRLRQSPCLP